MTKTYLVPVVITGTFGAEARVEADSIEEAKRKALELNGDLAGDALDWDRWSETKRTLGNWGKAKEEE